MNLKVSDSQIIRALKDTGGMIPIAAAKLGVTYQAIALRIRNKSELAERYAQIRELDRCKRVQRAERTIDSLLEANHFGAAELTLSRLGKDRGWALEKQGSANVAIRFEVVHIIPEAAEPEYWEEIAETPAPALPQYGTATLHESDPGRRVRTRRLASTRVVGVR
jgi:hypothetical protein